VNGQQARPHLAPQRGNASGFLNRPKKSIPSTTLFSTLPSSFPASPAAVAASFTSSAIGKNFPQQSQIRRSCQYLLTNNISVYGTNGRRFRSVGHWLPRPLQAALLQPEDVLPRYAIATGGDIDMSSPKTPSRTPSSRFTDSVRSATPSSMTVTNPPSAASTMVIDVHLERPARVPDRCQAGLLSNRIRTIAALIGAIHIVGNLIRPALSAWYSVLLP